MDVFVFRKLLLITEDRLVLKTPQNFFNVDSCSSYSKVKIGANLPRIFRSVRILHCFLFLVTLPLIKVSSKFFKGKLILRYSYPLALSYLRGFVVD